MLFVKLDSSAVLLIVRCLLGLLVILRVAYSQVDSCMDEDSNACILPQPLISHSGRRLNDLLLEVHCSLGCIEEYGGSLNILECKEGCLQRHLDPTGTINRCRDSCYMSCRRARNCDGGTQCMEGGQKSNCQRECRKTYCRFGCEVYDNTVGSIDERYTRYPPAPILAPSVVPVSSLPGRNWQYTIGTDAALDSSAQNVSMQGTVVYSAVAYILRISSSGQEYFYWQKNHIIPVDLSSFACSTISVSFAVVSQYNIPENQQLQFSPSKTLCISGVGGYPDQLENQTISVTYTEDMRERFIGYSVANVSWIRPNNFQFLTSYTIRVFPDTVRCGGTTYVTYTYEEIDRNLTSFILQAKTLNGLWRFGCTYLIEVVSLPTEKPIGETIGEYVSSTTELRDEFPPIDLNCSRSWSQDGHFNISVTWSVPTQIQTSHIGRFSMTLILKLRGDERNIIRRYNTSHIPLVENGHQTKFIFTTQNFLPTVSSKMEYEIEISTERNGRYLWREIPHASSCIVPAGSLPPSPIRNMLIDGVTFSRANGSLYLNVTVVPPENMNGLFVRYEAVLRRSVDGCPYCNNSVIQRFMSESPRFEIETTIVVNETEDHILLSVRAFNHYNLSSIWSQPLMVALEEEPQPFSINTDGNGSLVSIFYGKEGEKIKALEFWCESSNLSFSRISSDDIESRLQIIDQKIKNITMRYEDISQEEERVSQMEAKLQNIEEKLDNVIEMLNRQAT